MAVKYQNLPIQSIELDLSNPRIKLFLETVYKKDPTAKQIHLALGGGGDASSSFAQLKNSIETNGGIIQPILVNKIGEKYICVEGNTRVAIYRDFLDYEVSGDWSTIPAMVYENLTEEGMDAIRLQAHLVGPRDWDPYSKAKYLHYLRHKEHMAFDRIIDFCGGDRRSIQQYIQAYADMEKHYRPIAGDENFDPSRFSAFKEFQSISTLQEALAANDFGKNDFARWVCDGKFNPIMQVRQLPAVLGNPRALDIFLQHGMKRAIDVLDRPAVGTELAKASLGQLARTLTEALDRIPYREGTALKENPQSETALQLNELYVSLGEFVGPINGTL